MSAVLFLACEAVSAVTVALVIRLIESHGRHHMTRATRRRIDLIGPSR